MLHTTMVKKSDVVVWTLSAALVLMGQKALACGCGAPSGAVGMRPMPLVLKPNDDARPEQPIRPWRVAAEYAQFEAKIRFGKDEEARLSQKTTVAGLSRFVAPGIQIGGVLGATFDGKVREGGQRYQISPGIIGAIRTQITFVEGRGWQPFLEGAVTLAASTAQTENETSGAKGRWTALDLRASSTLGWNVKEVWFPYTSLRVFGGPVFWNGDGESRVGSDLYHFQLALGSGLSIPNGPEVFVDWSLPIGEWGLSAGLGYAF